MKTILALFILLASFGAKGQSEIPSAPADKALVLFIRPSELNAALDNWVLMADGDEFCRISNNRYVTYLAKPGKITFSAKRGGIGIGKPKTGLDLEVEAGKTYYVQCDVKTNLINVRILLNETTFNTAKKFMEKAKPDNCEATKEESSNK